MSKIYLSRRKDIVHNGTLISRGGNINDNSLDKIVLSISLTPLAIGVATQFYAINTSRMNSLRTQMDDNDSSSDYIDRAFDKKWPVENAILRRNIGEKYDGDNIRRVSSLAKTFWEERSATFPGRGKSDVPVSASDT